MGKEDNFTEYINDYSIVPEKYYNHAKETGKLDENDRLNFSTNYGCKLFPHTVTAREIKLALAKERLKLKEEEMEYLEAII